MRWIVERYDRHLYDFVTALRMGLPRELDAEPDEAALYGAWRKSDISDDWSRFVATELVPRLGPLVYQKDPTIRVHRPGEVGQVQHTDAEKGHSADALVCWIPLTPVGETNGLHVRGQRVPIKEVGQMVIFPGGRIDHSAPRSHEAWRRVSFDARIIPADLYDEPAEIKWTEQNPVAIRLGDYYAHSDDLEWTQTAPVSM